MGCSYTVWNITWVIIALQIVLITQEVKMIISHGYSYYESIRCASKGHWMHLGYVTHVAFNVP